MKKSLLTALAAIAIVAGIAYATNGPYPSIGLYYFLNSDPTAGGGQAAPLNQLLIRTDVPGIYYKSGSPSTSWTLLGSSAGSIGGGGAANTVAKFTAGSTIGNSAVTDDGTTWALNTNKVTITEASGNTAIAGTANVVGDFSVATNKLTVASSSGNTAIAGTANVVGDFSVATNKFTSAAASGNTAVAGTLGVTGLMTTTGGLTQAGALITSGIISPAALVGPSTTNDYAPTSFSTCYLIRQDVNTGSVTLTGLAGGASGRTIVLRNIGNFNLVLTNEDAGSAAANRFTNFNTNNTTITPGGAVTLIYDGTTSRWRITAVASSTAAITDVGAFSTSGAFTSNNAALNNANAFPGDIAPTALSGSTNNYAPTNNGTATRIRQDVSSAATLTGLVFTPVGSSINGRILYLQNISAVAGNTLTLSNESASSTAANRFTLPNAASWVIPPGGAVTLVYNTTSNRWELGGSNNDAAQFTTVNVTGATTLAGQIQDTGVISPSATTGTVNDYNPTSLSTASIIRQTTSGSTTLTGLTAQPSGTRILFYNIGANNIVFSDQNASSSAANRFANPGSVGITLTASLLCAVELTYDGVISRWRVYPYHCSSSVYGTTSFGIISSTTINNTGNVTISGGHLRDTGTAATLSSCGTSPTITGGAFSGTVTIGATGTGCTVTHSSTFTTAPTCTVTSETAGAAVTAMTANSAAAFTISMTPGTFDYTCIGH